MAERTVDSVLSHYGVLGMRWGVRKASSLSRSGGAAEPVTVKSRPGKTPTASGGRNQMPSEDAKKAIAAIQKAKASGTSSLSNADLKAAVERMRLEDQYGQGIAKLQTTSAGKKFAKELLVDIPKTVAVEWARSEVTKQVKTAIDSKTVGTGGKHRTGVPLKKKP